ncbi:hypothetical protein GE09DRAFT_762241 [Coniochaeta sp. 2T2.1]|nr:hypothetical protein GE09DRAFT_762241 [Coniochaeta sp. 2T2.1]
MNCIQKIKRMCRQVWDFTHIGHAIRNKTKNTQKTKKTKEYGIAILTEDGPVLQKIATKHRVSAVSLDGVYSNYSSPDSDPPDFDPKEIKAHCGSEVQTAVGSLEELADKGRETNFIHVVTYSKQPGAPDTRPQFTDYEDSGRCEADSQHTESQDTKALSISSSLYVNDSINTNPSSVESEPQPAETKLEDTKPDGTVPEDQPDLHPAAEDCDQEPVHPMLPRDFIPKVMMQPVFHTPTWCGTWVVEARDEMTMQWTTTCFRQKHDKDFKLPLAVGDLDEAKPSPKQQQDAEKWKGRVWHRINRLHYPYCVLHKVIERENWRATWVIEAKDLEGLKLEKLKLRGKGVDITLLMGIN